MTVCIVKADRGSNGLSETTPDPDLSGRGADHTVESFVAAQVRADTVLVHFVDILAKKEGLVRKFLEQCEESGQVRYFTTAVDGAPRRENLYRDVVTIESWEGLVQQLRIGRKGEREALSDV